MKEVAAPRSNTSSHWSQMLEEAAASDAAGAGSALEDRTEEGGAAHILSCVLHQAAFFFLRHGK